jgi:hypothetical protein
MLAKWSVNTKQKLQGRLDIQHNNTQHKDIHYNDSQHQDIQHKDT